MQITEIRIKLVGNRTDRLKAFATITFDNSFVVRDLKIIEGQDGYFVAMPSRKLTDRCQSCGAKNPLRSRFCADCGARLPEGRMRRNIGGRTKLHADVAHPVNSEARHYIQSEIVKAYERERELSMQPGYRPVDLGDDYDDDYGDSGYHTVSPDGESDSEHYYGGSHSSDTDSSSDDTGDADKEKRTDSGDSFSAGIY
ncbi:MAG: SpoVG family protein [Sedimentisphaerales bacterium]|nr:SpoVG family protein [Sedimentisphaerales bacterium]